MTPGPWNLRDFGHREHGGVYVVGARGEWGFPTVCEMPMQPDGMPCVDAQDDGRVIAAAPTMLEALEAVAHWMSDAQIPCCFPRQTVLDALNKAKVVPTGR